MQMPARVVDTDGSTIGTIVLTSSDGGVLVDSPPHRGFVAAREDGVNIHELTSVMQGFGVQRWCEVHQQGPEQMPHVTCRIEDDAMVVRFCTPAQLTGDEAIWYAADELVRSLEAAPREAQRAAIHARYVRHEVARRRHQKSARRRGENARDTAASFRGAPYQVSALGTKEVRATNLAAVTLALLGFTDAEIRVVLLDARREVERILGEKDPADVTQDRANVRKLTAPVRTLQKRR